MKLQVAELNYMKKDKDGLRTSGLQKKRNTMSSSSEENKDLDVPVVVRIMKGNANILIMLVRSVERKDI